MGRAEDIEQAVRKWIVAEWQFRYGPHAYQNGPTDAFLEAERVVRKLVVGKGTLDKAYARITGTVVPREQRSWEDS